MITREQLIEDEEMRQSRALGCLGGLAIGDTMGELARSEYYRERYGIVSNLYGESQSTDDTEFAVLIAKIVLSCQGELNEEVVYEAWMKHVVEEGIGSRVGASVPGAAANLRRGIRPPFSGMDNVNFYDDGVAMRVAPIGIVWAGDPERAAEMARIEGQITNHADGIWAGQAIAASCAVAMVDGTIDEIVEAGLGQIPEDSWLGRSIARAMCICDEEKTLENSWERLHDELWTPYRASAAEAIAQVYALFRLIGDRGFRTCVIVGSNFGRDADTLGAILGALGGAKYGADAIPEGWIDKVRKPRGVCLPFAAEYDIVELAQQLAELIR